MGRLRDCLGRVRYHYHIVDVEGVYVSGTPVPGDDALDARWVSRSALETLRVNEKTKALLRTKFNFSGVQQAG